MESDEANLDFCITGDFVSALCKPKKAKTLNIYIIEKIYQMNYFMLLMTRELVSRKNKRYNIQS